MIKVIVLIRKRPDISAEAFRRHYETVHAPLIDRLLPFYATYRRNYVEGPVREGGPDLGYDVLTELEFANPAAFDAWRAELGKPEVVAQIRADEANFLISSETRMWTVTPLASDYA